MKKNDTYIPLPCGKCPPCLARRASGWSLRLMAEDRVSDSSHFITLTYDSATLPLTRNGYMSLSKRHFQLFVKRLRKSMGKYYSIHPAEVQERRPLRYYACGEYGGKGSRPHYHIIFFNVLLPLIQEAWGHGHVHYGTVTALSVGYTLKYMCKQKRIPLHSNDDRLPEFSLMSKKLGINYLTPAMLSWHKADLDNRVYATILDGKKVALPRYYKNKIYSPEELGHLKGVFERQAQLNDQKLILQDKVLTIKQRSDAVNAAFSLMYNQAGIGRNYL